MNMQRLSSKLFDPYSAQIDEATRKQDQAKTEEVEDIMQSIDDFESKLKITK